MYSSVFLSMRLCLHVYVDMFMQALCQDGYILCLYVMHIYGENVAIRSGRMSGLRVRTEIQCKGVLSRGPLPEL